MFIFIIILVIVGIFAIIFINNQLVLPGKIKKIQELMDNGEFEKAFLLTQALPKKVLIGSDMQYLVYEIHLGQKQYFMALSHLNEIIKRENYSPKVSELLVRKKIAELYELMEKPKKALEEYHSIIRIDPENIEANQKIGMKLYQMKNFGAAHPYLEKSYELNQNNNDINCALGDILFMSEHFEEAINIVNNTIKDSPDNFQAFLIRGKCYLMLEDYENCIKDMNQVEKDSSMTAMANIVKGLAFYRHNEHNKAIEKFEVSLSKFPEDYSDIVLDARYGYAEILYKRGAIKDAVNQLQSIRNSGKTYLDVDNRITVFKEVLSNVKIVSLFKGNLEDAVNNEFSKGLTSLGFTINKKNVISPKSMLLVLLKNVGSANSLKTILALDININKTDLDFVKKLVVYSEVEGVESCNLFSLVGLTDEASHYVDDINSIEIRIIGFPQIEEIISGKRMV